MKAVIQIVENAKVSVDNKIIGQINKKGLFILLGVHKNDSIDDILWMVKKIINLRIFEDKNNKLNLSASDINADILLAPQFTLMADTKKGNRPSFTDSADKEIGIELFNITVKELKKRNFNVQTGLFGAHMIIENKCIGPVTIILDSKQK